LRSVGQWRGEIWNRRKDGEIYAEWLTISTVNDAAGQTTHYVAIFSDATQLKPSQERMDFLPNHDALTGLPNRILLQDRLSQAIRRAQRERGRLALLFVDLDRFKKVNDTLGHEVGDRLLEAVARRLGERLRGADTLSRLGGDEFLILLDGHSSAAGAAAAAQACLDLLRSPLQIDTHAIPLSASIGISLYPTDGMDAETLIRSADLAMYHAKERGRGNYQFHAPEMSIAAQEQHALENALRGALARGELGLLYQPQIELATGHLWGVEALARWAHPDLGAVAPERFIPVAERIGLIGELGEWVLTEACRQLVRWRTAGFAVPRIAVNVSIQQLARSNLLPTLQRCLVESGLVPEDLEVEVTESVIVGDNARVITALSDLRSLGISLVVDDFGTGACALGRINRVPIDRLKIHGSFIRCIGRGQSEEAITRAIIDLGRDLGLAVIAEGVEREDQSAFLQAAGCRLAQGYLFGEPMDADALGVYLGRAAVH
jgi:diguanylate cyclase (GGDEF)-like protein